MINKNAIFFSTDAIIALLVILLTLFVAYPAVNESKFRTQIHSDTLSVLSNLQVGDINNSYIESLVASRKIKDPTKTLLEQIGIFYGPDRDLSKRIAEEVLSSLDTKESIGIWYANDLLAYKGDIPFSDAKNIIVDRQRISGLNNASNSTGYSARAFLSSSFQSRYFYFGGYVGDGNISVQFESPGNVSSVLMELAINNNFSVYVNDYNVGNYTKSSSNLVPGIYEIPVSRFVNGTNLMELKGTSLHIAGGFIKVIYDGSPVVESRKYFPGIKGAINLYDSFFSLDLKSLKISLHMNSVYSVFLNIGNVTVYQGNTVGEQTVVLSNSSLSSLLNYSSLSNSTIPLRLGLRNVSYVSRNPGFDIFSVSPLPSSFSSVHDSYGNTKVGVLTYANKGFIDSILNNSGVRVGLIGVTSITPPNPMYANPLYYHPLSNNSNSLKSTLANWNLNANSCLCCGINNATQSLISQSSNGNKMSIVLMSDNNPNKDCGSGPSKSVQDAISAACSAHANYGIDFSLVYLGAIGGNGYDMMVNISNCTNGTLYIGDSSNISLIYKRAAQDMIDAWFYEQTLVVSGAFNETLLYPDSYIEFNSISSPITFGSVLTLEKIFDNSSAGIFQIPSNSRIFEAKTVSYSNAKWTDLVKLNGNKIFNLSNYGRDYIPLGDPYVINLPKDLILQNNTVEITNSYFPGNSSPGSVSNKVIYTIIKNVSSYSDVSPYISGCIWTIQFEDGTNSTFSIPSNYSGSSRCYYKNSTTPSYDSGDAYQLAVYNLLKILDLDSDRMVDNKFSEQNLEISPSVVSGIPYAWSAEVQVRVWN